MGRPCFHKFTSKLNMTGEEKYTEQILFKLVLNDQL
jgi:hypothetical protein